MEELSGVLIGELKKNGASLVGFADLAPLSPDCRKGFPRAVSLAIALDPALLDGMRDGPTPDYFKAYREINQKLGKLGERAVQVLAHAGYQAEALPATMASPATSDVLAVPLPNKTAATLSGLGWIGRCALLVTPEFGPALRFATVLTDAPLPAGVPIVESRCGDCTQCVTHCPGKAPLGPLWKRGMAREEFFNAPDCRATARKRSEEKLKTLASVCGICIAVCPWTMKYARRAGPRP